jgi:hypothetical protein
MLGLRGERVAFGDANFLAASLALINACIRSFIPGMMKLIPVRPRVFDLGDVFRPLVPSHERLLPALGKGEKVVGWLPVRIGAEVLAVRPIDDKDVSSTALLVRKERV